jgi:imidazolonepropionase-like amidohydrolase
VRTFVFCTTVLMLLLLGGHPVGAQKTLGESPATDSAPQGSVLLRNVRVFESSAGVMSEPQDILIAGGRIVEVGRNLMAIADAERIDCAGKYAVPGLFDCHIHLAHLTNKGGDTLRTTLAEFVARGITHVRDVGGPVDVLHRLKEQTASGELLGPEIFYTGPMLEHNPLTWDRFNKEYPGFTVAVDSMAEVDSILPALARQGACMIKTFNKQDPVVYRHMVETARRLSLSIVHDPGEPLFHAVPMDVALDLGVTSIEHAKSPWPVVLKDDLRQEHDALLGPGHEQMAKMGVLMKAAGLGVGSISEDRLRQLAEKMKEKHAFLCPTLFVLMSAEKEAIEESRKQMGVDSLPAPALQMIKTMVGGMAAVSRHFVHQFAGYGVKMLVGQDGNDPAVTFTEMRFMKEAGVTEAEIIKGATLYPAQWLGVDDRLGTIAPQRQADLLVVNGDPLADIAQMESTFLVVQNGRVVRNHGEPSFGTQPQR